MKKKLISILFSGVILSVSSQTLITENFDALNTGNFATTNSITYATTTSAQNGWSIISNMAVPQQSNFQIQEASASDKRLTLMGSPTAPGLQSGSNYIQKSLNWGSRTSGNDVVYAECLFNTGSLTVSKNEFYFAIYNTNKSKCLGGYIYVHDTHILKGLAYDSTNATTFGNYSYSSIGTGNTSLVLEDNTDYYLVVGYDVNNGKTNWFVSRYDTQNVALCNSYRQNQVTISDASLLVTAVKAGTLNTASSTGLYDNITVQARPCYKFQTQASAEFDYTSGMHCLGTSDLISTQFSSSSTGVYTSSPSGLAINSSTGLINMSTSQAGTYSIIFITNNPSTCLDSVVKTITLSPSIVPAFSIIDLICTGSTAPILPLTSDNTISGTWSPTTVSNTISGTYTFSPTTGQCVLPITKTINVATIPVTPLFTIPTTICTGSTAPILSNISNNSVTGNWSPSIVNNNVSTTYTFTPISGSCAISTSAPITVSENITPTFTIVPSICSESTAPVLATTSNNNVQGTWSPSIISNTATGTYSFTPNSGSCATSISTTVTITPNVTPTFTVDQSFCSGEVAPILETTSTNSISGTWLPTTISNTSSATYTFTPTSGICATSTSAIVTILDCAGIEENSKSYYSIFPNPAINKISISFSELAMKNGKISFYSADGKIIEERFYNNSSTEVFDLISLKAGVYFLSINDQIEKIIIH